MSAARNHATSGSRLWPVLTVLFGLIGSTLALEVYARTRDPQAIVVAIRAHVVSALAADEAGDDEGSEVEADPTAPLDAAHASARDLGRRGDVAGALAAFEPLLAAQPNEPLLHGDRGYLLLLAGRPDDAARALQRARELGSTNPFTLLNLGVALRRLERLPEAEKTLADALAAKPGFRAARLALSTVLRKQKRYAEAIAILKELVGSGGNAARARALLALGRTQLAARHVAEADQAFEKAIEWAPAEAELRVSIARAYLSAGGAAELDKARATAETASELAPDLAEAHATLGRACELSHDAAGAEQAYETALRLDPEYHYVRRRLLRLALDARSYAKARAQAERLLAQAPQEPEHHFLAGLVAARAEDLEAARAHYRAAIDAANGQYPEAHFNLGALERDAERWPEAIAEYEQAIATKPDYLAAYNNLGLAHAAAGDPAKAEVAYRNALEREVSYLPAWVNLGKLELGRKRYPEAVSAFERAVAVRPKAQDALLNLGVAYRKAGRLPDAIATYRKLLVDQPRYVSAWYNLGIALERAKQPAEARDAYEQALAIDAEHALARRHLAALYVARGDLRTARAHYENVLDHDPTDRRAWIALANLERRQGDVAGCSRAVHAALAGAKAGASTDAAVLIERCKRTDDREQLQL